MRYKKVLGFAAATLGFLALVPVAVGQDGKKAQDGKKGVITKELLKEANFKAKIPVAASNNRTGGHEGKPCATDNRSTSTSRESTTVTCNIGGVSTTCNCEMDCTNTCENKVFSTDCTLDLTSCSANAVTGSGGGTEEVQVQGFN